LKGVTYKIKYRIKEHSRDLLILIMTLSSLKTDWLSKQPACKKSD